MLSLLSLMLLFQVLHGPDDSFTLAIKQHNCVMGVIGGKERTLAEWVALFSTNGWAVEDVIHKTAGGPLCSLITVAKALVTEDCKITE